MTSKWTMKRLADIADFNPRESLRKGALAKKVAMDQLEPFCRDIPSYELSPYSGGTKFRNGDTIMARITPCLENGKIAKVNILEDDEVGFGSTEYIVFRAKDNTDPDYLYYLVSSSFVREPAIKSMVGSSGRQRVQTDVLQNLELNVPPFEEQQRIGSILRCIDDKIALNQRINKNLQEQANDIFENAIQQSNDVFYMSLDKLATVKGGKRLPKGVNLITMPNSHPYIRIRDINNVIFASLSSSYEYVDDIAQQMISGYIVSEKDVLVSIVGTIGLTAIVDKTLDKANLTENCVRITDLNNITPEYLLLYLRSPSGIKEISKGTVGAVQSKLPIKNIQRIPIPLLPLPQMYFLNDKLHVLFSKISENIIESKKIESIRNLLLPKLMSGEIGISHVNI